MTMYSKFCAPGIVLLVGLVFCACSGTDVVPCASPTVRIVIETLTGQASNAKVYVEASDGNLLTGARVVIHNSSFAASLMDFSFTEGAYTSTIPPSSDGKYTVTVQSSVLEEKFTQTVVHYILTESPQITLLQDELANSALSGATLEVGKNVNIEWSASPYATVYQVRIRKDGTEVLVQTVSGTSVSIAPSDISLAGAYTVSITAQFVEGDPLLENSNYYSFSEKVASSVLFLTQ